MVLSPEHPYIAWWKNAIGNWDQVTAYVEAAARKSDFERTELAKEKTGVKLEGRCGDQPRQRKEDPDFHLGLCSGVLRHRGDHGGAGPRRPGLGICQKFGCEIIEVVQGGDIEKAAFTLKDDTGIMVNSDFLNGLTVKEAIP